MTSLRDKVVVITGSSRGIGGETALAFAKEGAKVVVTYYTEAVHAEQVADMCSSAGAADVFLTQLNILDEESMENAVDAIINRHERIDILINNAGVLIQKPLVQQTFEEIEHQIRTNLEGTIKMTKVCLPYIKDTIINIGSGAGETGFAELSVYCATKFGVRGFTQSLSKEADDLSVYVVNPGMTATEMTNFQGVPAEEVAKLIVQVAKGDINAYKERDVDVRDFLH